MLQSIAGIASERQAIAQQFMLDFGIIKPVTAVSQGLILNHHTDAGMGLTFDIPEHNTLIITEIEVESVPIDPDTSDTLYALRTKGSYYDNLLWTFLLDDEQQTPLIDYRNFAGRCFMVFGSGVLTLRQKYNYVGSLVSGGLVQITCTKLNGYLVNGEGGGVGPDSASLLAECNQLNLFSNI